MTTPERAARRARLSPQARIGLGVLLTLVGLFILGGTVPTAPGPLERDALITGLAAVTLWVGGILLGGGRR